ncbi:hypothetical protein ACLOJK_023081, partial [Asimina triloba]
EKVLRSSTELISLRSEIEALRACGTDPNIGKESSRTREVLALQERIAVLSLRESELFAKSKTDHTEVARLRTSLRCCGPSAFKWHRPMGATLYSHDRFMPVPMPRSSQSIFETTSIGDARSSSILTIQKVGM